MIHGGCLEGCLALLGIMLFSGMLGLLIYSTFIPEPHCRVCGKYIELDSENYCPNCGTKTDSVVYYNKWKRP